MPPKMAPIAPCCGLREQMVEIALGPKGAFENGNIGALRRRMLSDKVVSAVLPSGATPNRSPGKSHIRDQVEKINGVQLMLILRNGRC